MAAAPQLSPGNENHLLSSSSVVQHMFYREQLGKYYFPAISDRSKAEMHYTTFDTSGIEVLRLTKKPSAILFNKVVGTEGSRTQGFEWKPLATGGVLTIRRTNARHVTILR